MPSRDQLLAMFVSMLQAPLNSFARICTSPLGGFARALDQMAEKGGFVKEEVKEDVKTEETKADTTTEEASASSENDGAEDSETEDVS